MSREGQVLAFPARASDVTWPVRSGAIPPLADNHSPRPETGAGLVSDLAPAETVVLTPPDDPGEQSPPARDSYEHEPRDRGPRKDEPGGTGKTQLATALAHVLWESRAVELLIWVTASSREA